LDRLEGSEHIEGALVLVHLGSPEVGGGPEACRWPERRERAIEISEDSRRGTTVDVEPHTGRPPDVLVRGAEQVVVVAVTQDERVADLDIAQCRHSADLSGARQANGGPAVPRPALRMAPWRRPI